MFFPFQLALPKTSVLLLCQHNSRFLTFFILFLPLLLGHFALCPLEVYSFFLFYVVSFAVFWGQSSLFFNVCLFQQSFPYLFYIVFCPLPFSLCFWDILLFVLWKFTRFFYSLLFHSLSFRGSLRFFAMSVCFNSDFLTFFILFFALCLFHFAFGTYCSLPFGSLLVFFILCCIIRCLLGAVLALFQCLFVSTVVSLPFCVLFFALCPFPLLLGHFALCPLEVYSFAYSLLFHSLSFWGSLRSFAMPVCFNSRFLTFFILFLPLCLFPFAFGTFRPLLFEILHISLLSFCPLLPLFVFLCVGFTFCITFDGNLLQKFVTRQKV